ncbi:MAG: hypothetical protein J6V40_05465 [Clostridia bacterium]|nr:hypothetical protein [Clostridia bacterium]
MDRKTYLEIEELNKKIYYANKSVDTIKEVSEKIKTDLELTNQAVVDSNEKISKNSENISVLSTSVDNNSVAIETLATNLSSTDTRVTNNKNNIDKLTTNIGNPNLLINGNFAINQRGKTTYTGSGYTVDRWKCSNSYCVATVIDYGIRLTGNGGTAYIFQDVENAFNLYKGKTLTFSVKINGVVYSSSGTVPTTLDTSTVSVCKTLNISGGSAINLWLKADGMFRAQVGVLNGYTFDIEYVKVEFGEIATPCYPRPYAEELLLCQRYYEKIDVSVVANKNNIFKVARTANNFYDPLVCFMTTKRTRPTVHCYSASDVINTLTNISDSTNVPVRYSYITCDSFRVTGDSGDTVSFTTNGDVTGYFEADAEI